MRAAIPLLLLSTSACFPGAGYSPDDMGSANGGYAPPAGNPHLPPSGGAPQAPAPGPTVPAAPASPTCSADATVGSCAGNQLTYCDDGQNQQIDCSANGKVCAFDPTNEWFDCLAPATTLADSCGSVTEEGLCDGHNLVYCSDGKLLGADCGQNGGTCGWIASKSWYDCVAVGSRNPRVDTCPGVPAEGVCAADILGVCDGGTITKTDCAAAGARCVVDTSGLASCVVDEPASACGAIDGVGECQGDSVVWCDGNALASLDCAAGGRVCGWNADQGFFDCVDAPVVVDPCNGITGEGICSAGLLTYCDGTGLVDVACDFGCGWNADAAYFDCLPEPVDPCGGIDTAGICDGNVLTYCDGLGLVSAECAYGCGWNTVTTLSECLPEPVDPCGGIAAAGLCTGSTLQYCQNGAVVVVEECVFGCAFDALAGLSTCLPPPPVDPCDGIDAWGICEGDTLAFCQDATLIVEDCAFGCGVLEDGTAVCLEDPNACGDIDAVGTCDGDALWYCQDGTLVTESCAFGCGFDEATGFFICL